MFAKLFKPKWQHTEPKIRCLALRQMKAVKANDSHILATLAEQDPDQEVRLVAALQLAQVQPKWFMTAFDIWNLLSEEAGAQHFQEYKELILEQAQTQLQQLQNDPQQRDALIERLKTAKDPLFLPNLVRRLTMPSALMALIPVLEDMTLLRDLVVAHADMHVRKTAVAALKDRQVLKALLAQFKNRDKTLYRVIRQRLQALEPEKAPQQVAESSVLQVALVDKDVPSTTAQANHASEDLHSQVAETTVSEVATNVTNTANTANATQAATATQSSNNDTSKPKQRKKPVLSSQQRVQLQQSLTEIASAIQKGEVRQARRLHQSVSHQLKALPIKKQDPLWTQWRHIKSELDEYRDWQHYAVLPKKESLLADMLALSETPLPPEQQRERVQRLQADWKALGVADRRQESDLWEKFQLAADTAFAHCQEFFDAQAELRARHLSERQALVEQLEAYVENCEWSRAQWRKVATTLRLAREQWRAAFPVSYKDNRPVQKRFDAVCGDIQTRLEGHRDRMAAQKKRLLSDMQACVVDMESTKCTLDEGVALAKQLQQQWSDMDYTHAALEKTLYAEFRAAADKVFGRREAERAQQKAVEEDHAGQAQALIDELKQLSESPIVDTADRIRRSEHILSRFSVLGPFPKSQAKQLQSAFDQAYTAFLEVVRAGERQQQRAGYRVLWQLLIRISQVETALLQQFSDSGEQLQALKDDWSSLEEGLPVEAEISVNNRFDELMSVVANEAALQAWRDRAPDQAHEQRKLVVSMEIAADITSSDADQELRLSLQVDRLSDSFSGQSELAQKQSGLPLLPYHELMLSWARLSPCVYSEQETADAQRFWRAYQALDD